MTAAAIFAGLSTAAMALNRLKKGAMTAIGSIVTDVPRSAS
jgi:hypothetical protein